MVMVDVISQPLTGGPIAQVHQLGPKVASRLALFCIHHMNQANSRNDSESWCQQHKNCSGIITITSCGGSL